MNIEENLIFNENNIRWKCCIMVWTQEIAYSCLNKENTNEQFRFIRIQLA